MTLPIGMNGSILHRILIICTTGNLFYWVFFAWYHASPPCRSAAISIEIETTIVGKNQELGSIIRSSYRRTRSRKTEKLEFRISIVENIGSSIRLSCECRKRVRHTSLKWSLTTRKVHLTDDDLSLLHLTTLVYHWEDEVFCCCFMFGFGLCVCPCFYLDE